jgi:RNA polymerase sigma-70 factor (ECF subfamily)
VTSVADADALFAEHRQGVFRYLYRIVGHSDTARDLTQEVFLRVTRSAAPDSPAGSRAWVFTIARNLAFNHIRDRGRRPVVVSADTPGPERAASELPAAITPAAQELAAAIREALDALQDLDRDVFLLRESAGLSYDEIAATCDLTTEAVRARLRRAREHLRSRLDGPLRLRRQQPISYRGGNEP